MSNNQTARATTEVPPGEDQGVGRRFGLGTIAAAFGVEVERVAQAVAGEFGSTTGTPVDSRQAQHLAEVLLADQPLDRRQAALMQLGAFTPRSDVEWGLGDGRPGEESDLLASRADVPPTELASPRSSHDPATQPVE
ncbi:MAG TPA: hypothetical protein VKB09_10505 [Thermomicrobiales bacterium]|nr:hypothetical protein [Thermomicrobiales bacterium]